MIPAGWKWLVLLGVLCGGTMAATAWAEDAAPDTFTTADEPSWVDPLELDPAKIPAPGPRPDISDGTAWLLTEDQVRLGPPGETNAYYHHYILQFLTESGVNNQSTIQVQYDPRYQRLEFHRLRLWRDGKSVDGLRREDFHTLQRELNLEWQMLDGRITVVALPKDVRVGDALEAAYSIHGDNPVFEGRYSGSFILGWSVPLERQRLRVLAPADRPLRWWSYSGAPSPQVLEQDGWREWRWDLENPTPVPSDGDLPAWLRTYPEIGLGEYASWAEVADWALRQYPGGPLPEDMAPMLQTWRGLETPEDRLLAALDFVQREIRYFGLELAAGSHRANPPALVLQRRFGDCKDKALLLCTLLREMGIEAYPALVHTALRRMLKEEPPSPLAFDHVIVCVRQGSSLIWVDPTRSHQRGGLDERYLPPYGYALIVEPGTRDLVPVPDFRSDLPGTHIEEHFHIPALDEPATLTVRTRYSGRNAESLRAWLADTSQTVIEKEYLNYYATRYPGIASDGPVTVEDSPDSNQLVVRERYRIDHLWGTKGTGETDWIKCELSAEEINTQAAAPRTVLRTHPLGVAFPVDIRQTIQAQLPEDWPVIPETITVENDAIRYRSTVTYTGQLLTLDYRFQTLADAVPAERVAAHVADLEKIREDLGYTLTHAPENAAWTPNWPILGSAAMLFLLSCGAAVALYRHRPARTPETPRPPPLPGEPVGLGGWLALVGLGLCLRPFVQIKGLADSRICFDLSQWQFLTQPGGEQYHPLWAPALLFELHVFVLLLAWSILMLALFFKKRRSFPRLMVVLFLFELVCATIDHQLIQALPAPALASNDLSLASGIGIRLAWMAYLLLSRRVKNTFTRP